MQLFYSPDIKPNNTQYSFSKEESKHIIRVLRKKENDVLNITDGKGYLYEVTISIADQKNCIVNINNVKKVDAQNYKLHIAIAPTKMNDRMEWFLEKATEIGIHEITPIICDNSERKIIKKERLEKIIHSAMKQSLQMHLPILNDSTSFKEFMQQKLSGQLFIAHCEEGNKKTLQESINKATEYTILIGPEGDFSTKEIKNAISNGYIPVSLGNTRLRTETAGIVACHTVALHNN